MRALECFWITAVVAVVVLAVFGWQWALVVCGAGFVAHFLSETFVYLFTRRE